MIEFCMRYDPYDHAVKLQDFMIVKTSNHHKLVVNFVK